MGVHTHSMAFMHTQWVLRGCSQSLIGIICTQWVFRGCSQSLQGIQQKLRANVSGLSMLCIFENISIGPLSWMSLSEYWTPPECYAECTQMPLSDRKQPLTTHWVCMNANEWMETAPEHPLSAHECHWVNVNARQMHVNAIELLLNVTRGGVTMRKTTFLWELNSPWMWLSAHECLWVSIEYPLNTVECTWTPLSEYLTCPEC